MDFMRAEMERPAAEDTADDGHVEHDDRRIYVRFAFRGTAFPARVADIESTIRLKDLSCGGASALSEMPLTVGDVVYLELDPKHTAPAEVRWVRRLWVGLRFVNPLPPMLVRKVHADRSRPEPPFPVAPVRHVRSPGSRRR